MLRMTPPLIAWAQAVALMVVGTQAMMLPPAFLPTPPTIKKKRRAKMKRSRAPDAPRLSLLYRPETSLRDEKRHAFE